jgi:hypothetical protein
VAAQHARLSDLIERTAARAGLRFALPAGQLARILLSLHDGLVLQRLAVPEPAGTAVPDLERTALLHMLRAVTTD